MAEVDTNTFFLPLGLYSFAAPSLWVKLYKHLIPGPSVNGKFHVRNMVLGKRHLHLENWVWSERPTKTWPKSSNSPPHWLLDWPCLFSLTSLLSVKGFTFERKVNKTNHNEIATTLERGFLIMVQIYVMQCKWLLKRSIFKHYTVPVKSLETFTIYK